MGISLNLKEKILSKSNSYNYYKEENKKLNDEVHFLKKEINHLRQQKKDNLRNEYFKAYKNAGSFCEWDYMEYLYRNDFEDKLKNVTKNLDSENQKRFKEILIRALFVNMIKQKSLYFDDELLQQEESEKFKMENCSPNKIKEFTFFGKYNLHAFMDLIFTKNDKQYIANKDIIDAGAYTGDTTLPLSKLTTGNVYAFEPFSDSYDFLTKNINANKIKNIIPVKKSLGNKNGERNLFLSGTNFQGITSDSNIRPYDKILKVEETTIDAFVDENNLNIGLISVDVEGAEMDLLEGAKNTIINQKPILNISIYHKVSDFFDIIPWVANLKLGYEFQLLKEEPSSFLTDTIVKCKIKSI